MEQKKINEIQEEKKNFTVLRNKDIPPLGTEPEGVETPLSKERLIELATKNQELLDSRKIYDPRQRAEVEEKIKELNQIIEKMS